MRTPSCHHHLERPLEPSNYADASESDQQVTDIIIEYPFRTRICQLLQQNEIEHQDINSCGNSNVPINQGDDTSQLGAQTTCEVSS